MGADPAEEVGMSLPDRFWRKVHTDMQTGCWRWIGAKNSQGYGVVQINKVPMLTHRAAWQHFHGPIAPGLTVDHLCGQHNCANPEHMELVTLSENSRRGRPRRPLFTDPQRPMYQRPIPDRMEVREPGKCRYGHDVTKAGAVQVKKRGETVCLACRREAWHRDKHRYRKTA